jgi:hypothetical protein
LTGENPVPEFLADLTLGAGARGISAAQRKLRPSPLDLVFARTISGCVHIGPVYIAGSSNPVSAEWFRVGVTNSSPAAVDAVRVQALELKPDTLGILPAPLHWKDDNPPIGRPNKQAVTVPASKTPVEFVDVVSHTQDAPVFQLVHIVPGVVPLFPIGEYELTLVITGDGVKSRQRTFSLSLDDRGHIEFSRLR